LEVEGGVKVTQFAGVGWRCWLLRCCCGAAGAMFLVQESI
jgi:hypothetical protein